MAPEPSLLQGAAYFQVKSLTPLALISDICGTGKGLSQKKLLALAGVAQWIERQPANQRVTGWIPSQGTCLGCRPGSWQGAHEKQPHIDVSLLLFLPPFSLSLKVDG